MSQYIICIESTDATAAERKGVFALPWIEAHLFYFIYLSIYLFLHTANCRSPDCFPPRFAHTLVCLFFACFFFFFSAAFKAGGTPAFRSVISQL